MNNSTHLLKEAASEIKSLRRENQLMRARLEVFDSMMLLLHTSPASQTRGATIDLVWQIEKHIAESEKKP